MTANTTQAKENPIRLMDLSHGSGCGCKIGPNDLNSILNSIDYQITDTRVLVGNDTGDDAAVIQVSPDLAIVHTTDFFTPIMNDPYQFGQVAAANALSDVYAMGATPLSALSLVAFPINELDKSILANILKGGIDKSKEAGIEIVGGHSIDDSEPKFGLAVTGTIHPNRIIRNRGAKLGDTLILTKPLGAGFLTTGIKRGLASTVQEEAVFQSMAKLNNGAAKVMQQFFDKVHAATDITGFGLAGHLYGMLKESGLAARISMSKLPLLPSIDELIAQKCWPGGTGRNFRYVESVIQFNVESNQKERSRLIVCDPQTSGGILLSVSSDSASLICNELLNQGCLTASVVGKITDQSGQTLIEITQ